MKLKLIIGAVLLLSIVSGILLFAEDPSSESETQPKPEVNLTMNAKIDKNKLSIAGTANLPNGALISYEAMRGEKFKEGAIKVENSQYRQELDVSDWSEGEIEVWVAFQTILGDRNQPDEVIKIYGENGQNIPDVEATDAGYLKRIEITKKIIK